MKDIPARWRSFGRYESLLGVVLLMEILIFAWTGKRFASRDNLFEVLRVSVEMGLLALVITPVLLTGGIDLSVGSLLGLCGVVFGKLWRDGGVPPLLAAMLTLVLGVGCGLMNGALVTRWKLPPLIVTLGSFSLFRGLAEGLTRGVDNFTGFPASFLFLGQGYWFGIIPAQLPLFLAAAAAIWILVHRTVHGRCFRAIGFSPEGAAHAGLPVDRRLMSVYALSGLGAAVSSLVYVAHLGQARADAGQGYELLAITAVVLGGTSIFGGIGSVHGTWLGLAILSVLKNGLSLSDQPAELVGILTGGLLIAVLSGEMALKKLAAMGKREKRDLPSIPS